MKKPFLSKDHVISILAAGVLYLSALFITDVRASMEETGKLETRVAKTETSLGGVSAMSQQMLQLLIDVGTIKNDLKDIKRERCTRRETK